MISSIINEYSFANVILLCFQIILPLLIYIISFTYVSDEQSNWFNNVKLKSTVNIISGNKGTFIGCVVYILTGMASLLIIDFYHNKNMTGAERIGNKILTRYFEAEKDSNIHFFLFPTMILLSNLGFIVAYQTKDFLTHTILTCFGIVMNLYLMFHYSRTISYNIALLLLPLLLWQIFNVAYYGTGIITKDNTSKDNSSSSPANKSASDSTNNSSTNGSSANGSSTNNGSNTNSSNTNGSNANGSSTNGSTNTSSNNGTSNNTSSNTNTTNSNTSNNNETNKSNTA